jgi:hypothetical protein
VGTSGIPELRHYAQKHTSQGWSNFIDYRSNSW